jgi:hypothetical protein
MMRVRMGRKPRRRVPCAVPGCPSLAWARGLCGKHLKRERRRLICNVAGCGRRVDADGRCKGHRDDPQRAVRPARPRRSDRILAWGRLVLQRDAARRVEEEARRRGMSPSGFAAFIVEAWAADGAVRLQATCAAPGCTRSATTSGLCRTHALQDARGQPLTPIRPKHHDMRLGSLRLRPEPSPGYAKKPRQTSPRSPTLARGCPRRPRPTGAGHLEGRLHDANRRPSHAGRARPAAHRGGRGARVSVAEVVRRAIARQQS